MYYNVVRCLGTSPEIVQLGKGWKQLLLLKEIYFQHEEWIYELNGFGHESIVSFSCST